MKSLSLEQALSATSYPGRGIILGRTPDGGAMAAAYFIMGRSVNSRNRIFEAMGEGLRTRAWDDSLVTDPSLIIYAPVRVWGGAAIITNGDQTDTIYEYLSSGRTFEEALRTRTFEPDAPNYTPRISGLLTADAYRLSILKSAGGNPDSAQRFFYEYENPLAGQGHFIHTYRGDGDPLPSFEGEPTPVDIPAGSIDEFTQTVWQALDPDNRVSLFTRYIRRSDDRQDTRIVNKHS